MEWIPWTLLLGFCAAFSFLLSGMEAGVFALSRLRIRQWMRAGRPPARVLHGYLENPENFLWTILIGNTVANFISISLVVIGLYRWLKAYPLLFLMALVAIVFFFYVLCDLLPKMLFRQFPNRLCLLFVRPFRIIHWALRPLVALFTGLSRLLLRWTGGKRFTGHLFGSRDELRLFMQESAQGAFTSEERTMINRVLDLQTLTARQIAVPMAQVISVSMDTPLSEVVDRCREHRLTRLPVCELSDRRRFVGLISLKTFLHQGEVDPRKTARDYLSPALYFDAELRLETALERLQRSGERMAIVMDSNLSEIGIITLQDVLNVIFGEVNL